MLYRLLYAIRFLYQVEEYMAKLNGLIAEVEEIRGTVRSAIALIDSLAERIAECECDPDKLSALVADLQESRVALASAVVANSEPVDPPLPEDPVDSVDVPPADPVA